MTVNSPYPELSFSVPYPGSPIIAEAKRIRRLNGKIRHVLWELDYCFDAAEHWDNLTPVDKITLEENGTIKLLELLELYNRYVGHSVHYRLREKEEEEG